MFTPEQLATRTRPRLTLDGIWQLRTDPDHAFAPVSGAPQTWRPIDVPAVWQLADDELRDYQGRAWYRRSVTIPAEWAGRAIVLHFGAVDYEAEVWVDGAPAGSHTGGYLPFELDITALVRPGEACELLVRVDDPSDDRERWPASPFSEIPHGKQSWYGPLSGIWQPVWLEARAPLHLASLKATPDPRNGRLVAEAALSATPAAPAELALTVHDPAGRPVASATLTLTAQRGEATLEIPDVVLWDVDQPALYTLEATLDDDQLATSFGFRTFEARDGSLWLNDRPLMLRAALDQDYYPDTGPTPPSLEFLIEQMQLAKQMGLNCLRCHIKAADPRYLEAADRVGVLVWAELPNWQLLTPEAARRALETIEGQIERDWNHPSVVIWTVVNESWGTDLTNPEHRAWLREAFERIKAAAPGRLVVDNSPCFPNFHVKTDLDDFHFYAAMPDERERWRDWVAQFAARPIWSYGAERPELTGTEERWRVAGGFGAPLAEVERRGDEPLIVSEFGNWGLPSLASLRSGTGSDPWWFESGDDWGDGVAYPHGVERRFARLGLGRVFGDYEAFAAATRQHQLEALQFEIEEMRRHPSIAGYVITELTDLHWECNGLLDMRRAPKLPLDALADLNAETLLIPNRELGALRAGAPAELSVAVSHWGAQPLEAPLLRWTLTRADGHVADEGRLAVAGVIAPRTTLPLGDVALSTPLAERAEACQLRLELWEGERRVAATQLRLAVYPRLAAADMPPVYVHHAPELRERLATLGWPLHDEPGHWPTIATACDDWLLAHVRAGGRALLIAADSTALTPQARRTLGMEILPRSGTTWQGSWASSFAWVRGARAGTGLLDDRFSAVLPDHVIAGFAQTAFPTDVLAGLVVGWVHHPAALAGVRRLGHGQLLATTLRLGQALGADPSADALLADLLAALWISRPSSGC